MTSAGRSYTHPHLVGGADVGAAGVAHVTAIARWLQEAAVADGLDAGLLRQSAWIIRRSTMRIERMPRFSEKLELRTWCSGMAKSVAERSTSITGSKGARIDVEAIWVHIDPQTRRPARLAEAFAEAYGESAAGRRARSSLRHDPAPPAGAEQLGWSFARADVDIAGHVNNTMYWRVAEEYLDLGGLTETPGVLEAEYRAGIESGPAVVHRHGGRLWVSAPDGTVAATITSA